MVKGAQRKEEVVTTDRNMIPKKIFTIWFDNDNLILPQVVCDRVNTQVALKDQGYEHKIFLSKDFESIDSQYLQEAIREKAWDKASHFLKLYYLNQEGGIYLDPNCEVLPNTNFDNFLNARMFIQKDSNWIIGSESNHPFLNYLLDGVSQEKDFNTEYATADREGLDMKIYEPNDIAIAAKYYGA